MKNIAVIVQYLFTALCTYGYIIVMESHQFYVSREISDIILRNLKEPFKTFNNLLLDMLEELIKSEKEKN